MFRELIPHFWYGGAPWEKSSKYCCKKLYLVFTRMDCIRNACQWLKQLACKKEEGQLC